MLKDIVDNIVAGAWTIEDAIEVTLDEISTSGSVGSGVQRSLGAVVRFKDEEKETMEEYQRYLNKLASRP